MKTMRTMPTMAVILASALAPGRVFAAGEEASKGSTGGSAHVMMAAKEVKWGDAPPSLPKGAKLAVVQGDPATAGEVVALRLKMPKGYVIPPHFHPTDEAITVLSGGFGMGMGDKLDKKTGKVVGPGGWGLMPKGEHHYAFANAADTVVQVHMIGPFAITYVNPDDDPQKKASK